MTSSAAGAGPALLQRQPTPRRSPDASTQLGHTTSAPDDEIIERIRESLRKAPLPLRQIQPTADAGPDMYPAGLVGRRPRSTLLHHPAEKLVGQGRKRSTGSSSAPYSLHSAQPAPSTPSATVLTAVSASVSSQDNTVPAERDYVLSEPRTNWRRQIDRLRLRLEAAQSPSE
jgi:hypothetical protein